MMSNRSLAALLLSLQILKCLTQNIINTSDGRIMGISDPFMTSFLGIRYAQAPVKTRRFAPPIAVRAWNGTYRAVEYGPICIQPRDILVQKYLNDLKASEDCLNMNIFVPRDKTKYPVLIYVHSGQFQYGAGAMINGTLLALETESIVVTINYRLGILGFASFPSLSGNFGLQDQILAIRWVNKNIAAFGGDKDNVAILADSVNAKILRYSSKLVGAFSKIISLPFDIPFPPQNLYSMNIYLSHTNLNSVCNGSISLTCLRRVDSGILHNLTSHQSPWTLPPFRPVEDGDVVKGSDQFSSQDNRHIEQIHLNVVGPSYIYRKTSVVVQQRQYQCSEDILKNVIQMVSTMTSSNTSTLLETFYFPDDVTPNSICDKVLRLLYDYASVSSLNDMNRASKSALVYMALLEPYYVLQSGTSDPLCVFKGWGESCDLTTAGFVLPIVKNFLQHGYPSLDNQIKWHPYTVQSKNHLIFNGYKSTAANKSRWPLIRQENLWYRLVPAFKKGRDIPSIPCQCLDKTFFWYQNVLPHDLRVLQYGGISVS
ncbi:neuroligin-2-like isoform X2 [Ostrea edulis]|uniref:neuroligin-2-like isoform X2 n=1 Tax=Ostrea edulis TaxID=37623 RepID=UPI0020945B2A|nr:neuroligin-2-like isoform X2 [Ostrea edulis]